jgi:hypothetical protein
VLTVDYDRLDLRPGMTVHDLGCGERPHAFEAYRRGPAGGARRQTGQARLVSGFRRARGVNSRKFLRSRRPSR